MSLTVNYSVELCRKIDREVPSGVKWFEEALPPDDYEGAQFYISTFLLFSLLGYSELKRKVDTTLITCGEHEYGRAGFRALLEKRCADVLQPDITWVGGLTEAKRIVAMASAYDIPVCLATQHNFQHFLTLGHSAWQFSVQLSPSICEYKLPYRRISCTCSKGRRNPSSFWSIICG